MTGGLIPLAPLVGVAVGLRAMWGMIACVRDRDWDRLAVWSVLLVGAGLVTLLAADATGS